MGKSSDHRIEKIFDVAQFYLLVITTRGDQFYFEGFDGDGVISDFFFSSDPSEF